MLYMDEKDLKMMGVNWLEVIEVIKEAVTCLENQDYAQPVKPYLRYHNPKNRIIAMPAFVGGNIHTAGIKWIASFPDNIEKSIPRAHSVVILNEADTGEPKAIVNTALLSIIRTASVSGAMIQAYKNKKDLKNVKVGIIGWGPIGQYHFKMVTELLGDQISEISLYDIRKIEPKTIPSEYANRVRITESWEEAYLDADIFMTCTVASKPYINKAPKKGSLHLNVSLRDYQVDILEYAQNGIIVDDWDEVCRENTDIEMMHLHKGLQKGDTYSIVDVLCRGAMDQLSDDQIVMFNPMGMAIFDISVGNYYYQKAQQNSLGKQL